MIDLSILIPHRDQADDLGRLVPQLVKLLQHRERPFEIVCIDDASDSSTVRTLERLQRHTPALRVMRLSQPAGLSAALTVGIAAARGELLAAIECSGQYLPEQIPWLIERLARADLVFGRRQSSRPAKLMLGLMQLPRRALLGLEARDPDCLLWAARREAVAGFELAPGMHRFLGSLVTTRGYRVAEMHIDHHAELAARCWTDTRPSLGNLLATWWQRRKWRAYAVTEVGLETSQQRRAA